MQNRAEFPSPPDPLAGREDLYEADSLPPHFDSLPPVEPPSAGFIVQLFLVPALIVTVVIGVYLLFGRLASGEQDWRKQLSDVRSDNPHVRWRGALGLAQMLQADVTTDGARLAENRDVATELSGLLQESLASTSTREDDYKQQEFLTRALALLNSPDITFPVLLRAMDPAADREVRKNAIASIATTINRLHEQSRSIDEGSVLPAIIAASDDSDALIRHLATYTLGMFETADARDRLQVMLDHGDELTRVNAAVALARHGSLAGVTTFEEVLLHDQSSEARSPADPDAAAQSAEVQELLENSMKMSNTLQALNDLSDQLDATSRQRFIGLLEPIAENHADSRLRIAAQTLLRKLRAAS